MALKLGSSNIDAVYVGAVPASSVYVGAGLAWSGMDPATRAWFDATGLDAGYDSVIDDLVVGLKDHTLWNPVLRVVYPYVGVSASIDKWNLFDPRDDNTAFRQVFTGGTHSTALGYRPNALGTHVGASGKAETHFVPVTHLPAHSASLVYYSTQDTPGATQCEMGCYSWDANPGFRHHIIGKYGGDTGVGGPFYYGTSENGATSVSGIVSMSGLFVATRTASNAQAAYRNGAQLATSTVAGIAHPNVSVWVGGINTYADKTDRPCGFAAIGQGLNAQQNADLYTVVQAYNSALGRAV